MSKFIVWNMKERKDYFSSRIWRRKKKKEIERADDCEKISAEFAQSYVHCIVIVFDKQ